MRTQFRRPTRLAPIFPAWPRLALVLALTAAGARPAAAQGILFVRVSAEERPVANATVEVLFQETVLRRLGTDEAGAASFAAMPAGTFVVRVEALGYTVFRREDVRVSTGSSTILEVTLESAPIALEGLTIRSERVQIQRENSEFNTRVDEVAIKLLPVTFNARDLVALTPGARPGNVWGGANFQANNYRIDGLSANHPGVGGDLIQPNINWIERVDVRGLGAGAEYGGFQGGLIDITTKRGDNDFRGLVRTSLENEALNSSNLVSSEIGTEVVNRSDVEGEIQGALVRDKLFFYASAQRIRQERQALNHLRQVEGRFTPALEDRTEEKLFGKLTWTPTPSREVEASAAYLGNHAENFGLTGYEAPGAAHRYSAPTWLMNASWRETLGSAGVLEAGLNHFSRDERHDPYQGEEVPGLQNFALWPPYTAYQNNPFTLRSAPSSTSGHVETSFRLTTGGLEHVVKVGAEMTHGSFLNRRTRNGDLTWLPVNQPSYRPDDPATWGHSSVRWIPSQWGGEVRLDADVANAAAYAQSSIQVGSRLVLSPGVRWNQWTGWLTPQDGDRFQAVQDQATDLRVGASLSLDERGSWVLKGHWGRYHQDLITQMFDRVAGGDVFSNEEIWYYRGDRFTDPTTRFTVAERDALAAQGLFTRESVVSLNESGPLLDYRQPYIDQWLVGLEKQFDGGVKIEALYTRRRNHDMVALVDLNRETNYTRFDAVRVYDGGGQLVPYQGGSLFLKELWIPNYMLRDRLEFCQVNPDVCGPGYPNPPGMTYADVPSLTWDPDYRLTTAPGATREFGQFQLTLEVARPAWGASFSFVATDLKGNLDNVSGYVDPQTYDAGPYVRVNEGVNAYGSLDNFADMEAKVSIWGNLPGGLRGGAFWTYRTGDHYSPQFRISSIGLFRYRVNTGALNSKGGTTSAGQELDYRLMGPLENHYVFVGPRGLPTLLRRANLDLHLERSFALRGRTVAATLDVFNVMGVKSVESLQNMVNNGRDWWPDLGKTWASTPSNMFYGATMERVPPRTLRLGMGVPF
jgi:hypothetical protein